MNDARKSQLILTAVSREFKIPEDKITGTGRPSEIVDARHAFLAICLRVIGGNFSSLSRLLGRQVSTINYSVHRACVLEEIYPAYAGSVAAAHRAAERAIAEHR